MGDSSLVSVQSVMTEEMDDFRSRSDRFSNVKSSKSESVEAFLSFSVINKEPSTDPSRLG